VLYRKEVSTGNPFPLHDFILHYFACPSFVLEFSTTFKVLKNMLMDKPMSHGCPLALEMSLYKLMLDTRQACME
jgi:hypothetical protein